MSRLAVAFCLTLLILLPLAAQQKPKNPPPSQFVKIPPAVAVTHLLKKVAPVYPAFARAAGIQGVVRVSIGIYPDGHVRSVGPATGWACLLQAAMTAAGQYVYKPFEKNGHRVIAETTVDVVFKLPEHRRSFHPYPAPELTLESLNDFEYDDARPASHESSEFQKWLSNLPKWITSSCKGSKEELLAATHVVEIPTKAPAAHLYVVIEGNKGGCPGVCGATGNCPIQVVEETGGNFHLAIGSDGFGFYVNPHRGSPYPDIFIVNNMSAYESDVDGYVNVDGHWGLLYCGKILTPGMAKGKSGTHLCR